MDANGLCSQCVVIVKTMYRWCHYYYPVNWKQDKGLAKSCRFVDPRYGRLPYSWRWWWRTTSLPVICHPENSPGNRGFTPRENSQRAAARPQRKLTEPRHQQRVVSASSMCLLAFSMIISWLIMTPCSILNTLCWRLTKSHTSGMPKKGKNCSFHWYQKATPLPAGLQHDAIRVVLLEFVWKVSSWHPRLPVFVQWKASGTSNHGWIVLTICKQKSTWLTMSTYLHRPCKMLVFTNQCLPSETSF